MSFFPDYQHYSVSRCMNSPRNINYFHFQVGDDGLSEEAKGGHMQRDTDCSFTIWCSGRSAVNHMQVQVWVHLDLGKNQRVFQIRTVKRQDFASRVMALFSPANDRVIFKVGLETIIILKVTIINWGNIQKLEKKICIFKIQFSGRIGWRWNRPLRSPLRSEKIDHKTGQRNVGSEHIHAGEEEYRHFQFA